MIKKAKRLLVCWVLNYFVCSLWFCACPRAAATEARLPNGTNFVFWEQPLQFSKTYFVDGNSAKGDDNGPGTSEQPFRTISKAAEVLQPGERVVIAAGIYRECIHPARGGTAPDQMISYEAAPGATVIVKGSETLNDGWKPSTASLRRGGGGSSPYSSSPPYSIWQHDLSGTNFPDAYNPFAMVTAQGDRVLARHQGG